MTKASTAMRIGIGAALAACTAAMLTLAFPPHGIWPLAWVGFVPSLLAQYRILPRRASALAPAITIGGWLGIYMIPIFGGSGSYMAWLPLALGAIPLLMDRGNPALHERTGYRWFVLHGVTSWVGVEMIRSLIPIMGTWAFLGYTAYAQPWLIQPVSIFGIFGLSLVMMLVNYALAQVTLALFDRRRALDSDVPSLPMRAARRWLVGAGIAAVVWVGLSLLLLVEPTGPVIRVAAVQVPLRRMDHRGYEVDPDRRAEILAALYEGTREAAQQGAQVVVWPEGALGFDPQESGTAALQQLAAETGAYLTIGYMVDLPDGAWRNEATVLDPSGRFLGVFGKDHPVVFGGERNTGLGTYPVYETPAGRLGTIICYDLDFTDTTRRVTRNGAQLIAAPSLDFPGIAGKHYPHVVFRAVENRVAMVKADGGYDSALVDPYGRILQHTVHPEGARAMLVADLPLGKGRALATYLGDGVGWLALAGLAFFAVPNPLTRGAQKPRGRAGESES